jgi:hypothetical protein
MTALLDVENLSVRYGDLVALRGAASRRSPVTSASTAGPFLVSDPNRSPGFAYRWCPRADISLEHLRSPRTCR